MATYLIINLIFLILVAILLRIRPRLPSKLEIIMVILLLLLTAIFDSLIIGFDIVAYNPDMILGLYIGKAPIEDFFYAILAFILVPNIWNLIGKKHD